MGPELIQLSQKVILGEIILLVRVMSEYLFYIFHTDISKRICLNCPVHQNCKRSKVGRSSEESVSFAVTNICVRLVSLLLVVGPWVLASASQSLGFPIYKMGFLYDNNNNNSLLLEL